MLAPLQPAGCAWRHQRDGAGRHHRAYPQFDRRSGARVRDDSGPTTCRADCLTYEERERPMAEFLFEIGLEEIPARMIESAEQELTVRVKAMLVAKKLLADDAVVRSYAPPRRVAGGI